MKLLLCSEGFHTPEIVAKCEELVGKKRDVISVAVINEAYAVEHDNNLRWILPTLNEVKDNFGGKLELVNVLALDIATVKQRIEQHDVIFVLGGNTDYLMSVFNKTGFAHLLPELLKTKVYVGSSAGSMVMGKRLSAGVYEKIYGERDLYGVGRYFELIDIALFPHLHSQLFPMRKEMLLAAAGDNTGTIYGLQDDSAIVVEDDKIYTIGSEPLVLESK
jgi:dipeptidase E